MRPWGLPVRWQFLLLFAFGFVARLGLLLVSHQYRDLARFELQRTAYSMATTGVFGNPYAIETGPTAHVSPGYPLILAGIYRAFGAGERGELVKETVASAVSAAGWALMPVVGAILGVPPVVGFVAGLLGAALPLKLSVEAKGDWEAPYSALATMWTACLTASQWRRRTFTTGEALRSGFAWGVSLLFMSALLPVWIVFAVAGYCRARFRPGGRQFISFIAIQAAMVALFLAPWIVRNERQLGSPVVTRSNFGLELRLSNNDRAGPLERENYVRGVYHLYHPLQSLQQAERVKALGEPAFNRESTREALAWMREHPSRFVRLTCERIFYFWFQPIPGQTGKAVWLGLLAVLGFIGLWHFARKEFWVALPMVLLLFVLPLPNYLVHVGLRHRYPLDWVCLFFAVYAVYQAAEDYRARRNPLNEK